MTDVGDMLARPVKIYCAVIVRYGRSVPKGFLPVYSVDSEDEAHALLTLACATNNDGEFIARELAEEQTLDNLYAFGHRLCEHHKRMLANKADRARRTKPTPR